MSSRERIVQRAQIKAELYYILEMLH